MINGAADSPDPVEGKHVPGTRWNEVTNNIFVDGKKFQTTFNHAAVFAPGDVSPTLTWQGSTFHGNIVYLGANAQPVPPPTPPTQPLFFYEVSPDALLSSETNLYYYSSGYTAASAQLTSWRAVVRTGLSSFDPSPTGNNDPQFLDYAHDNYALATGSPAMKTIAMGGIGFQPINFAGLPPGP